MDRPSFVELVALITCLFEARRIWRYKRFGIKDIHPGYRLIVAFDKPKEAKAFLKDVEKNWEKSHLRPAWFMVAMIPLVLWSLLS